MRHSLIWFDCLLKDLGVETHAHYPRGAHNKALQLTARQHASQVTSLFSLNADRAPQLKASVSRLLRDEEIA
jgi:hypothetical protein